MSLAQFPRPPPPTRILGYAFRRRIICKVGFHRLAYGLKPLYSFGLFHSFQVTIGVFGHEEKVIYEPLTPAAIQVIFNEGLYPKARPYMPLRHEEDYVYVCYPKA